MDIYFLLDISASMKPIQDRLVQVPNKLIEVSEAVKTFFVSFVIKQNIKQQGRKLYIDAGKDLKIHKISKSVTLHYLVT